MLFTQVYLQKHNHSFALTRCIYDANIASHMQDRWENRWGIAHPFCKSSSTSTKPANINRRHIDPAERETLNPHGKGHVCVMSSRFTAQQPLEPNKPDSVLLYSLDEEQGQLVDHLLKQMHKARRLKLGLSRKDFTFYLADNVSHVAYVNKSNSLSCRLV